MTFLLPGCSFSQPFTKLSWATDFSNWIQHCASVLKPASRHRQGTPASFTYRAPLVSGELSFLSNWWFKTNELLWILCFIRGNSWRLKSWSLTSLCEDINMSCQDLVIPSQPMQHSSEAIRQDSKGGSCGWVPAELATPEKHPEHVTSLQTPI